MTESTATECPVDPMPTPPPPVKTGTQAPMSVGTCPETPSTTTSASPGSFSNPVVNNKVDQFTDDSKEQDGSKSMSAPMNDSKILDHDKEKLPIVLETPPRTLSTSRMLLLSKLKDNFPSPDTNEDRLTSHETDQVKEFVTPTKNDELGVSTQDSNDTDYIKPSALFVDSEAGPTVSTTVSPMTPESGPGLIISKCQEQVIENDYVADDVSFCSSDVPFDCVDDYKTCSTERKISSLENDEADNSMMKQGKRSTSRSFFKNLSSIFTGHLLSSSEKKLSTLEDLETYSSVPPKDGKFLRATVAADAETGKSAPALVKSLSSVEDPPKPSNGSNHNSYVLDSQELEERGEVTASEEKVARKRNWVKILFYIALVAVLIAIAVFASLLLIENAERSRFEDNEIEFAPPEPVPDDTYPNTGDLTVVNDLCIPTAVPLDDVQYAIYGSTAEATWDKTIDVCGDQMSIGYGQWHTYRTDESKLMRVSTCDGADFDTQITIMTGACGDLTCVTFNDQACGDQSSATFFAEAGKVYYILVHGFREARGTFALSIEQVESNDECSRAGEPLSIGSVTPGTTLGARINATLSSCGEIDPSTPGVWYVLGNAEGWLKAEAIGHDEFQSQVSVYRGSGCNDLQCEVESSSGTVSWKAESDSVYYVRVSGLSRQGNFDLYVGWDWEDTCDNAVPLLPSNVAFIGSTNQATPHDVPACGFMGTHTAPGIWFSVQGTGKLLEATACSSEADLDTQISVFRSGCGDLQCIGGTGQGLPCGGDGIVTWSTDTEEEYLIYVSGRASRIGDFWLTVDEATARGGADCFSSVSLGSSDAIVQGSTTDAPRSINACDDTGNSRGLWYKVEGNGNTLSASTCNADTNFDARVSLFTGSCGGLVCALETSSSCEFNSELRWTSDVGSTYYLLVHGPDEWMSGDFVLTVQEEELNDACGTAQSLETRSNQYFGSTSNAGLSDAIGCGNSPQSANALWYTLVGTGGEITVSTCSDQTEFDTEISIFSGSCSGLTCVASASDGCGDQALVSFKTTNNEVYFIRVSGAQPEDVGNLVMSVSVKSPFFGW